MVADLLLSLTAAGSVYLAITAILRFRRFSAAGPLEALIDPLESRSSPDRTSLFSGIAARFATTYIGRAVSTHHANTSPATGFSDYLALIVTAGIAGGLTGHIFLGGAPAVAVCAVAGASILDRVLARGASLRLVRLEQQLPEALRRQASVLRAGRSTVESLREVGSGVEVPLSDMLGSVVRATDLGRSAPEAMERFARISQSRDVELWVVAMLVHRQTGGNLAATVESLGERIRERQRFRSEVRVLTAQGRLSGLVVGIAPAAFLALLSVADPDQMRWMFSTGRGLALLAGGILLEFAGFVWIRRIVRIRSD